MESMLSSILSSDKPLRMWDICSRQEINVPKPLIDKLMTLLETHEGLYSPRSETGGYPNGSISAIAIMPDSKQILTALNAQDNPVIKIFDLETGFEVNTLRGHETPVTALALTPDGRYAISASFWDGKIKIWELDSYTEIATLYGHNDFVTSVAITRDGRHLISTSKDTTLKVWNLSTRKEIASFTGDNDFRCCMVSPDGRIIVAGETSGRVHFLRLENMD
jgi:WD40 repeat protein